MRLEIVDVTPDMARAWLDGTEGLRQRHITPNRVSAYASAMQRGQWLVTHQPIAIDEAGVLIDGQHRLSAVVQSHKTVKMSVAYDVPRDTFVAFDAGMARSVASTLHIQGVPDAAATAAAAKLVMIYEEIQRTRRIPSADIRQLITGRDVLDFVAGSRGDTLRQVSGMARMVAQALGRYGARSWLTAAFCLIAEEDMHAGIMDEFAERCASGAGLADGAPILAWRRWMISEFGYGKTTNQHRGPVGVASVLKTWNAWVAGEDLKIVRFRVGKEIWPGVGDAPEASLDMPAHEPELVSA